MLPLSAEDVAPGGRPGLFATVAVALFGVGAELWKHAGDAYHIAIAFAAVVGALASLLQAINAYLAGRHARRTPAPLVPWQPSTREPNRR